MITDGVININKPEGWTSQDVCAKLRNRLHIKKTGHTGTLDPMAAGVLPVCTGRATRIIEYYSHDRKTYHAAMKLGLVTDTLDMTGEVLETSSRENVTENAVREAFRAYTGHISQVPPKYSALKLDGKRAYELAREGRDFKLKAREIEIFSNMISRLDLEAGEIEFDVTCSKGTYIRTICDDIGRTLGCGAVMTALTRTASGFFTIREAVDIRDAAAMSDEELQRHIIPLHAGAHIAYPAGEHTDIDAGSIPTVADTLGYLGKAILDDKRVIAFTNGNSTREGGYRITMLPQYEELYRVYADVSAVSRMNGNTGSSYDARNGTQQFLGVASIENGELIPRKVIK